jgi:hypothetical protein
MEQIIYRYKWLDNLSLRESCETCDSFIKNEGTKVFEIFFFFNFIKND